MLAAKNRGPAAAPFAKENPMLVILTGAGVSKESGLSTFRDAGGIWQRVNIDDVATPGGFARDPALVNAFYNERRAKLQSGAILPNAAHIALARLEETRAARHPGAFLLITQNIDNLHERAGSQAVLHMHGELLKARCQTCHEPFPWLGDITPASACPLCTATDSLRPHVVWFGETPLEMETITQALSTCRTFVAIGTSGQVYPAAGFVKQARRAGARTIEINPEPTAISEFFDQHFTGPATRAVGQWIETLKM